MYLPVLLKTIIILFASTTLDHFLYIKQIFQAGKSVELIQGLGKVYLDESFRNFKVHMTDFFYLLD